MRQAILLTVLAGVLAALWVGGVLLPFVEADRTGIVPGIIVVTVVVTALSGWRRGLLRWVLGNDILPALGFLGTIAGFSLAISGVVGAVEADKLGGVVSALYTTGAGLTGHLWLLVAREATRAP